MKTKPSRRPFIPHEGCHVQTAPSLNDGKIVYVSVDLDNRRVALMIECEEDGRIYYASPNAVIYCKDAQGEYAVYHSKMIPFDTKDGQYIYGKARGKD